MATYNPGSYQPPQETAPAPAPLGTHSRGNSYADQTRPRTYSNPPPQQPDPTLLGPQQLPYQDPYAPASYLPAAGPHDRMDPTSPREPDDGYTHHHHHRTRRPSHGDTRHHSHTSQHSRHSHDSRRSHGSRHSRHFDDDVPGSRRSHESRRSHHSKHFDDDAPERTGRRHSDADYRDDRDRKLKRKDTHRPTLGDSLFSVWDIVKSALGPRDKY